jgi:hypothetical protein
VGFRLTEDDEGRARYYTHARWEAVLSDGTTAVGDDGPGEAAPSAWMRLRDHCAAAGVFVVELRVRFRSHGERPVPAGAAGYFFRTCLVGWLDGVTQGYFLVGHQAAPGGPVRVQKWSVPELLPYGAEDRDPADEKGVGPSLITRPYDFPLVLTL